MFGNCFSRGFKKQLTVPVFPHACETFEVHDFTVEAEILTAMAKAAEDRHGGADKVEVKKEKALLLRVVILVA